jgi:hypothetical protein
MGATALLLNWKRSENLKLIINCIKSQSIDTEILLWNNNPNDKNFYDVDLQINSSKNLMCYPRWFMMNYAKYDHVFTLDDDLFFKDSDVLKDCVEYLENNPEIVLGMTGVILNDSKHYWRSMHVKKPTKKDISVDIIKGRFMMGHVKAFEDVILNISSFRPTIDTPKIEDDIYVSSFLEKRIIPKFLHDRFSELNTMGVGCYGTKEHHNMRIKYTDKFFNNR